MELSPRQRRALAAISDTFAPGGDGVPSASQLGVPEAIAEAIDHNPREAERRQLALLLTAWDAKLTTAIGRGGYKRFSGLPADRREAVLRSWAMIMANTSYIQFFLTDVEVELAGDVAVLTCVENILTAMDPNNPAADPASFAGAKAVATNVFRRTEGQWRLWVHHGSPVLAADGRPRDEPTPADDAGGADEE